MADDFDKQSAFVQLLELQPILLEKSQIPTIKIKKHVAADDVIKKLATNSGVLLTKSQLFKKINNMKTEVRKKTDLKKTGNQKIVLKEWEERLLKLIDSEINPAIMCIPGAVSVGATNMASSHIIEVRDEDRNVNSWYKEIGDNSLDGQASHSDFVSTSSNIPPPPVRKRKFFETIETGETKDLSTHQLQRLVLLEQLKLIRLQQKVVENQLTGITTQEVLLLESLSPSLDNI